MMNVLRHLQPPQRPLQAGWLAVSMGLLLGLGGSVWQAQQAELNLPKLRIEKPNGKHSYNSRNKRKPVSQTWTDFNSV